MYRIMIQDVKLLFYFW